MGLNERRANLVRSRSFPPNHHVLSRSPSTLAFCFPALPCNIHTFVYCVVPRERADSVFFAGSASEVPLASAMIA